MAKHSMDQYAEAKGGKKGKNKLSHIEIHPAENGGHTVKHVFANEGSSLMYKKPEENVFGDGEHDKMMAHVSKTLGLPSKEEETAKEEKGEGKTDKAEDDEDA